jgi:hypothetical protein
MQQLVYCAPDTRSIMALTVVTNGVASLRTVNHQLKPTVETGLKFSGPDPALTETFLDLISGGRFARVSAAQALELDSDTLYIGAGQVAGLFVEVPEADTEPVTEEELAAQAQGSGGEGRATGRGKRRGK